MISLRIISNGNCPYKIQPFYLFKVSRERKAAMNYSQCWRVVLFSFISLAYHVTNYFPFVIHFFINS